MQKLTRTGKTINIECARILGLILKLAICMRHGLRVVDIWCMFYLPRGKQIAHMIHLMV